MSGLKRQISSRFTPHIDWFRVGVDGDDTG